MAFKYTNLGQLIATNPAEAHRLVTEALDATSQNQVEAAARLGVHRDTLGRWLDALESAGHPVAGRGSARRGRKPGAPAAEPPPEPEEPRRRGGRRASATA